MEQGVSGNRSRSRLALFSTSTRDYLGYVLPGVGATGIPKSPGGGDMVLRLLVFGAPSVFGKPGGGFVSPGVAEFMGILVPSGGIMPVVGTWELKPVCIKPLDGPAPIPVCPGPEVAMPPLGICIGVPPSDPPMPVGFGPGNWAPISGDCDEPSG